MRKNKLKERLLAIQQRIFQLENAMETVIQAKKSRDIIFKDILNELGVLYKTDLWEQLEKDRSTYYNKYGKDWSPKQSLNWLSKWFDNLVEETK